MQSETLCSKAPNGWWNWGLFRKNAARFWPIWGGYLAVWLFLMPMTFLFEVRDGADAQEWAQFMPIGKLNPVGLALAILFGILCAMAVFSYLYNPRSVGLMHSLPIRREGLFFTNYVSGLLFLLVPQGVVFVLTLLAEAAYSSVNLSALWLWLLMQTLLCLFFYSFAVFCAMFTGNLLALPLFYGILNFLALGMAWLLSGLFQQFVYGFTKWHGMADVAVWLSPAARLYQSIYYSSGRGGAHYTLGGVGPALLYAFVGLVLAAVALIVYRRRQLERAGDIVAVAWVRPVFKYGVAFCCAVALGSWLYHMFAPSFLNDAWTMLVLLLLGGLVGYFAAEMLLKKTFRVFQKGWPGALACCVVLAAAALTMQYDLIGFNRVPTVGQVASVSVQSIYSMPRDDGTYRTVELTDPEDIQKVLELHSYITRHKQEIQQELNSPVELWAQAGDEALWDSTNVYLDYQMADGSSRERQYRIPIRWTDLSDPETPAALLTALLNQPENVKYAYLTANNIPADARPVEARFEVYDTQEGISYAVEVEGEARQARLLEAVMKDMDAGRIGRRFLFDDSQRQAVCYTSNLEFTLFKAYPEAEGEQPSSVNYSFSISLQTTASETLGLLEEWGLIDETHILTTHAQDLAEYEQNATLVRE